MSDVLKILMLEDSSYDAEIVLKLLRQNKLNFDSTLVMDEASFVQALDQFQPDLILSDNSLPQFSATEALEIINQRGHYIPFILITGTVSEEFAAGIIKLGADDYIIKDRLTRLPAAIAAAMQKKKAVAAMQLKEEEIKFKANLLSTVGQALIATNLEGIVIYWNEAAEKMYGWLSEEALGRKIMELTTSADVREESLSIMDELKNGKSWSGEFIVRRKDGMKFPAFVTNSPIYDQQGNLTGIIGVSNDISERKKAEQELRILEERILDQKIQQQKNITRAIIKAQEQERNRIGQELHDNVTQILAGTKLFLSSAALKNEGISSLLDYPIKLIANSIDEIRLLSSKHVTPLKNINLKELVELLIDNLNKSTSIQTSFVYNVSTTLLQDEFKLNIYRIVQEQINNIVKHAAPANVSIRIEEEGRFIIITIKDDGKGFDVKQKRSGIGISNMINRIESFNGIIQIESAVGKGSTITVSMPYEIPV
jgi:two-component system, NarL family, sensor histidine kinase UhpB